MYDISTIIWEMTNKYSSTMENKVIPHPKGLIEKYDEYVKAIVQNLKAKEPEIKTVSDEVNVFWDYSAFFFLSHIYTELQLNDLSKERKWLKTKLCELFKILKNKNNRFNDNWVYWQYAQAPWREPDKSTGKSQTEEDRKRLCDDWLEKAKIAVKQFDPAIDYNQKKCNPEFAKATPCEKSDWLNGHLKALKDFIGNGECGDKHFAYVLYLLLQQYELGLPRPTELEWLKNEYEAVVILASFAAYIDNKKELFSNVNNYLTDYFFWFLCKEIPGRIDLDTWGGVSEFVAYSCRHMNSEGDLYTNIRENDELNSWIQLMGFFNLISLDEAYIVKRCFGYLTADSTCFVENFKKTIRQNLDSLKSKPGFVFCLYWMIHFMSEHDFNEVFLEQEKVVDFSDEYCVENGFIPIEKRHYEQNSLEVLQMLLFFILFDLTSKFERGKDEKKHALVPFMETIKDGTWYNKDVLLDMYKHLGQKINLNTKLTKMLNDFVQNDKTTKSMVLLVYNLSKFLRQDTRWLVNEVTYIRELQSEHLYFPKRKESRENKKNAELSEIKKKLREIDSGFKILSFMQKIPSVRNLVLSRELTIKIFIISDVNTLCGDDKFFRNLYRSLVHAKYVYFDRNMATHYAAFSKVEDLFDPHHFPDMLTALYDLTHNELNLQWFAMKRNCFKKIAACPYYKKFLAECLDKMEKFVLDNSCCKSPVFDDEGELTCNRKELKELGKKFWASSSIQKDKLKNCLNILYCNSDLMAPHLGYSTDFWNAYKYELAVYLIKVAIELTALYSLKPSPDSSRLPARVS